MFVNFCFIFILLHIHGGVGTPQQSAQLDAYANSRKFPQLKQQQQQYLFDANQNYYVPNTHNSPQFSNYAVAAAAQPYGYDANGLYQYPTPTNQPQLWSSAPIVVEDDAAANNLAHNDENLQTRPRSSKTLPLTYNIQQHGQLQQQQQLPSNYNYPNAAVYHSSDVWRQQQQHYGINASPQSKEQNSLNYNQPYQHVVQPTLPTYRQQQPQQQQQRQHNLHASNTDLNYLQATPINHKPYSSAARGAGVKDTTEDYSKHFKEYLRKHPRRIKPEY